MAANGAAPANRDERGRFPKGVSGHPQGRPTKDRLLVDTAQAYLEAKDPETKTTRLAVLLNALYTQGLAGNTMAARELLDRAYGKPMQRFEASAELVREALREYGLDDPTDEDVANILPFARRA